MGANTQIELMQDMTAQNLAASHATEGVGAPKSILERFHGVVALAILLAAFVTLNPFSDLGDLRCSN